MKVKVIKRETSVLGPKFVRGQILDITEEKYKAHKDEFELVSEPKNKPAAALHNSLGTDSDEVEAPKKKKKKKW